MPKGDAIEVWGMNNVLNNPPANEENGQRKTTFLNHWLFQTKITPQEQLPHVFSLSYTASEAIVIRIFNFANKFWRSEINIGQAKT